MIEPHVDFVLPDDEPDNWAVVEDRDQQLEALQLFVDMLARSSNPKLDLAAFAALSCHKRTLNVSAIAKANRVSRPTVYRALRRMEKLQPLRVLVTPLNRVSEG